MLIMVKDFEKPNWFDGEFVLEQQGDVWGPITKLVVIGSIQAAGYANTTWTSFLLNPVDQPMLSKENKKFGNINSPPSNENIAFKVSAFSIVPSESSINGYPEDKAKLENNAMKRPFMNIDVITAI